MSKYLGNYLSENYSFKKHDKDIIDSWNKDYKNYIKAIEDLENSAS